MPDLDTDFRRLAARGHFQIQPAVIYEKTGTEVRDGRKWEVSEPRFRVGLTWWPRGQGPGRKSGGNPFCQRDFTGTTVAEVLARAVEATRPQEHSLESLVSHYLYEQAKQRKEAAHA